MTAYWLAQSKIASIIICAIISIEKFSTHASRSYQENALLAAVHSHKNNANNIDRTASLYQRAFWNPTLDHDISTCSAFVMPTSGGVTASLFNHNIWRRKYSTNIPLITPISLTKSRWGGSKMFMRESSATDESSRSDMGLQYLQGDASRIDSYEGNTETLRKDNSDAVVIGGGSRSDANDSNQHNNAEETIHNGSNGETDIDKKDTKVLIHVYHHVTDIKSSESKIGINRINNIAQNVTAFYKNATLIGLGMSQGQCAMSREHFAMAVYYYIHIANRDSSDFTKKSGLYQMKTCLDIQNRIQTQEVNWETDRDNHLSTMEQFWKEEKLICTNTGLFRSNSFSAKKIAKSDKKNEELDKEEERLKKEENFRSTLFTNAKRLSEIVKDELSDVHHIVTNGHDKQRNHSVYDTLSWTSSRGLLGWMEQEYGVENTKDIMASSLLRKSEEKQLKQLQSFLVWFKGRFPYEKGSCSTCGASNTEMKQDEEDIISSLGCLYASVKERLGEATRTELFRCRNCNSYTRFPRYNKALWVTSMRRGRCGEYSMLLYRMLRSVGYEKIRYVVDWADHLWVEIWLGDNVGDYATAKNGRWVHCDPCEATVDEPLLYVSWNKIPTYIFAFRVVGIQMEIEDVTMHYTTDNIQAIHKRRGISSDFVTESIREVSDKSSDILRELRTTKK